MNKPVFVANWKMNKTVGEALAFVSRLKTLGAVASAREVVIAPPFTALCAVAEALKGSAIGVAAQNLSENRDGAFTGEVSARMLVDVGCTHAIVGHSERRVRFGETDEAVRAKIVLALEFGIKPIFCIGETLQQREAGQTFDVVEKQFKEGLNRIAASDIGQLVFAYEPIWAIGTGKTATPGQAQEVHGFIRALIKVRCGRQPVPRSPLLYGGSVNPENIGPLLAQPDIDGVLVGGASLDVDVFGKLIAFCDA
jgi:triosephosphate isomerase